MTIPNDFQSIFPHRWKIYYIVFLLSSFFADDVYSKNLQISQDTIGIYGGSVTMTCPHNSTLHKFWLFENQPINPSDRLNIENNKTTFSLIIKPLTLKNEGLYSCDIAGKSLKFYLTVEVSPTLELSDNNRLQSYPENIPVNVICKARGAKPEVSIAWFVDGKEINNSLVDHSTQNNTINTTLKDTTSVFLYTPNRHDKRILCVTSGQNVAKPVFKRADLNVLYAPACELKVDSSKSGDIFEATVTCICDGNPEVKENKYTIYKNGKSHHNGSSTEIKSNETVTLYCSGANLVNASNSEPYNYTILTKKTGKDNESTVRIIVIAFTVVVVVLVLIILIGYFQIQKKKGVSSIYGPTENSATLPYRPRQASPSMLRHTVHMYSDVNELNDEGIEYNATYIDI